MLNKYISIHKTTFVKEFTYENVLRKFPQYRYSISEQKKGLVMETTNLSTALAQTNFVCDSYEEAEKLSDYLNDLEMNHPEEFYTEVNNPILNWILKKSQKGQKIL